MSEIKNVLSERDSLREVVTLYRRYITYLRKWYRDHSTVEFDSTEPASFDEYCTNEGLELSTYTVEVTVNEASHVLADYTKIIKVKALTDLSMDQLKAYLILNSKFSIEDEVCPKTDTPDVVNIEIYDFDLELIEERNGE